MICPICLGEMSKTWQPQHSHKLPVPHVLWGCSTCGGSFTREQLKPKTRLKSQPNPPVSQPS